MPKISLVGSYNLADGYLGAAKALRRIGFEVDFIPASRYKSEFGKKHLDHIVSDIEGQKPDIILWWRAETLSGEELRIVRNKFKDPKFILYSWDDPYQWERHMEMPLKCKSLDLAFTCCEGSVNSYEKFGCKGIYCPPGFDPETHYPEEDEEYKCDVSIVCTNYYHGNELTTFSHLSRKDLLHSIIENIEGVDLRIYGPDNLKFGFEDYYKGWIKFEDAHKVFYNSKVNLCTHIRPDGNMYINERVTQILGSGGLLMVDPVNGIENVLDIENECVVMDLGTPNITIECINQIKDIINNSEKYDEIRKNGYKKGMDDFTWDSWASKIFEGLQ